MSNKRAMWLCRVFALLNASAAYFTARQFSQTPNWMVLVVFLVNVGAVVLCSLAARNYYSALDKKDKDAAN